MANAVLSLPAVFEAEIMTGQDKWVYWWKDQAVEAVTM